ncbi:hypothetical protein PAXRUDRAFT_828689, partial [Paxillus rubicundulus Ve08.2h10]
MWSGSLSITFKNNKQVIVLHEVPCGGKEMPQSNQASNAFDNRSTSPLIRCVAFEPPLCGIYLRSLP